MVHGNYNYNFESCALFQQIDAHRSPLVAMIFSSSGTYLATASQQGTIIRVHLVSQATEVKLIGCLVSYFFLLFLFFSHVRIYSIDNISSAPGVSGFR
ncbi:hypothetical protein BHE74_00031675 [Ensete ventricosum]|nr:hypothetical protein GW17_00044447 [Ensete ventricosum]RWW61270.1 hypothetical protein BHE74_00031675 [Ensete ventricosum]RZS06170.1 hypothetical protein BHM03_00036789 [Ensete ventricosum]